FFFFFRFLLILLNFFEPSRPSGVWRKGWRRWWWSGPDVHAILWKTLSEFRNNLHRSTVQRHFCCVQRTIKYNFSNTFSSDLRTFYSIPIQPCFDNPTSIIFVHFLWKTQ